MRSHSIDIKQIKINDRFWSKHVDLVRNAIIPYQWEAMNDRIEDESPVIASRISRLLQAEAQVNSMALYSRIRMLPNGLKQWDFHWHAIRMRHLRRLQMK